MAVVRGHLVDEPSPSRPSYAVALASAPTYDSADVAVVHGHLVDEPFPSRPSHAVALASAPTYDRAALSFSPRARPPPDLRNVLAVRLPLRSSRFLPPEDVDAGAADAVSTARALSPPQSVAAGRS